MNDNNTVSFFGKDFCQIKAFFNLKLKFLDYIARF